MSRSPNFENNVYFFYSSHIGIWRYYMEQLSILFKRYVRKSKYRSCKNSHRCNQVSKFKCSLSRNRMGNFRKRRENHKLIQFFKITNWLTPQYIQQRVPSKYFEQHLHNTKHSQNCVNVNSRTNYRHNSFIPSTIRLWNNLPAQLKQCYTLLSFKRELSSYYKTPDTPRYYCCGSRLGQILHARLHMQGRLLKQHLYFKNIEPDPHCICGGIETTEHFLLYCKNYDRLRHNHFDPWGRFYLELYSQTLENESSSSTT